MIAKGKIGLWGRIHVDDCPHCHGKHIHDDVNPDATVDAPCGATYTLDCLKPRLVDTMERATRP